MAWIALDLDDVKAVLSDSERRAVDEVDLSNAQTSPITEAISNVTAEVRGYVAGCGKNILTSDATKIPDSLKSTALTLIKHTLATRICASEFFINDDRVREWEQAYQRLRDVAACRFYIEDGDAETCAVSSEWTTGTPNRLAATSAAGSFGSDKRLSF